MKFLALATMCLAGSALALTGLSGNGTAVAGGAAAPQEWLGRAMPMDAMVKPHKSFMRSLSRDLVRSLSRFAPSLAGLLAPRTKPAFDPLGSMLTVAGNIGRLTIQASDKLKEGVDMAKGMANAAYRTAAERADALARQTMDGAKHLITIKNSLPFAAQVALANPATDVKYFWEEIPAGGTHTFEILGAVVFNMYVVPYVKGKATPPEITSSEEAFKAIKWYGTKVVTLYNVVGADNAAEGAAKEAWKQFKGAAQAQAQKELAAVKEQAVDALVGNQDAGIPDSPKSLAKMFREVKPSKGGESVLTLDGEQGIVLDGAAQQCQGDEEMFWGCCYKKCSALAGADHQFRCNFFMCGTDDTCAVANSKTDFANYGRGFTKSGLCRPPSAERVG